MMLFRGGTWIICTFAHYMISEKSKMRRYENQKH